MLCDICFIRSSSRRGVANKSGADSPFDPWSPLVPRLIGWTQLPRLVLKVGDNNNNNITKCLQVWEDMSVWFCFATFLLLLDCEQWRQHALELHTRSQLICYCFLWNKCWLFELGFELSCVTKYSKCVLLQVIIRGLLFIYSIKTQKNCSLMTDTNFVKWFFGTILS